jgi:peptidoglycan/LPS O-acetylase OafA/YrhL
MSESVATNHGRRLAWLDALRGFAALCVVFDHGSTLLLLPVRSFLYQWFNLGQYGVFVFFLVSGYIVPASLERKGSVRGFWIGRAFRLYPMFLVALALSAVAYETGHGTVANAGKHPLTAILGWVFMLQNLLAGLNVPVVTWTLSYEMVFYLLIAALFSWGIHRRSGWYATAFAVGAVALGGVLPMAALGHWTNGAEHGQVTLDAVTDALVLAGLGLAVLSRSWPAKAGASLAGLVALVLVTVNQTYPYPWSGSVILGLMFTGTLIYRVWGGEASPHGGTTPLNPPRTGGLRPPVAPPREDAQEPRAPRAAAEVRALGLGSEGAAESAVPRAVAGVRALGLRLTGAAGPAAPRVAAAVVVVLVFGLLTVAGVWHGAQRHEDYHWQVQWATSVLLAGATFGIGLAVRRWRVPRWCAWLGMISYSVYLLHPIVFDAYRSVPLLHRKHTMPDQVLFFAGLLAVIVALSALTYYLVEMPMQRLGRRVAARFPYATVTAPADSASPGDGEAPAAARSSASSSTAVAGGSGGSP